MGFIIVLRLLVVWVQRFGGGAVEFRVEGLALTVGVLRFRGVGFALSSLRHELVPDRSFISRAV